jgi:carboxyl-terminal processing protease
MYTMESTLRATTLVLAVAWTVGCGSSATVERTPSADPSRETLTAEQALATFDLTWQSIADTHFDEDFNGVDWDAIRVEFRPRAEAATTREELREVLSTMVARLGQSHFEVVPTSTAVGEQGEGPGDVGVDLRILDDQVVVSQVRPGGPAARAQVREGWRLVRVDDLALDPLLPEVIAPSLTRGGAGAEQSLAVWFALRQALSGPVGSPVLVIFEDAQSHKVEQTLEREERAGTPIRFANLPPFYADLHWRELDSSVGPVGYVAFNIWMLPVARPFDEAVDSLRAARGMVVDLRGNLGGVGEMVRGFAGHFLDTPASLGTFRTRDAQLDYVARPRRVDTAGRRVEPYAGPLAILIDEYTGSSSEIFAGGLQDLGRARVFGSRSAGAVLPARTTILPSGDTLLHATADFVTPSGHRLEGEGVVPDVPIHPTRADYLHGDDPVLRAAVEWIQEEVERQS